MIQNFFNLFLKSNCPICQRLTSSELCSNCTKQLQKCQVNDASVFWKPPVRVFAWGAYGGILKRAIAVMKYEKHPEVGRLLGQWLGQQWLVDVPLQSPDRKFVVVPIPIHPEKFKKRGFNQAAVIAKGFCDVTRYQIKEDLLLRVQDTQTMHSLSLFERQKNLTGAFTVKNLHTHPKRVLIIDDIYTTGTTASEAVITLNHAGIEVIGVAATAIAIKHPLR
ncbi:MAG: ComF family protein [Calothrix sp. FI2-JRJ7]|jgi:ComF family protein|nr:ComF family protein [Calothrix sp. FI2-JRJ7]